MGNTEKVFGNFYLAKRFCLPRPSPGWFFLPLILAALWALWYGWGALWSALSPMLP